MGAKRLIHVVDDRDVLDVVEIGAAQKVELGQQGLGALGARVGQGRGAGLLVDLEIVLLEPGDHAVDLLVHLRTVFRRAGDDERRAGLVDQDAVHLIDDGEVERPLDHGLERELHVVAQVIEAELVVGAVGDVGFVPGASLGVVQAVHDAADREPQELVDLAHPGGIAPGQIVVDRDHVHALAFERVQIDRQGRDEGLALAGRHLGDLALVEDDPADQLDVVVALPERALGRFPGRGEGFDEQVVEGLARRDALPERCGPGAEVAVAQRLERRLEIVDGADLAGIGLDDTVVDRTEQLLG